eukprot:9452075-Pyramimonas_sp.AAC.1
MKWWAQPMVRQSLAACGRQSVMLPQRIWALSSLLGLPGLLRTSFGCGWLQFGVACASAPDRACHLVGPTRGLSEGDLCLPLGPRKSVRGLPCRSLWNGSSGCSRR